MRVLGLDVSTSIIGVSIVDNESGKIVPTFLDHIDLTKCDTFWDKVKVTTDYFKVKLMMPQFADIKHIGVEEALVSFRSGMSSAQTITTLVAFNAVVRHVIIQLFSLEPQLVQASTARKKAGVKVLSRAKCGKAVKDQVFEHMCANDLSFVVWPRKKATKKNPNPDVKDYAKDTTDAYVVAKFTCLTNE